MNAFHVAGGVLSLWAVLLAFLGIRSSAFPGGRGERVVIAISVLLVAGAIGTAIVTAGHEAEGGGGEGEAAAAATA